jgi:hypothetical protein
MELSRRMEVVCRDNSITNNDDEDKDTVNMIGWRLVSSRSSIDGELNKYNDDEFEYSAVASNHSFVKRLKEEQVRMQQDMVDAVENWRLWN